MGWQDDPVKASKPAWQSDPVKEAAPQGPSAGQAALFGLSDPISTLDESQGLKGAILQQAIKTLKDPKRILEPGDVLKDAVKDYRKDRDKVRDFGAQAREGHPYLVGGGQVMSSMAAPIPGAAMRTIPRAIGTGIGLGATGGAGATEADLTKLIDGAPGEGLAELKKFGMDVATSGGIGAALPALVPTAIKAVQAVRGLPGALKSFAERRAIKATGGALESGLKKAGLRTDADIQRAGRVLLDEGVVGFGTSRPKILERSQSLAKERGKEIGDILDGADASGAKFNWAPAVAKVQAEISKLNPTEARAAGDALKALDDIMAAANGGGGFAAANDLKAALNDTINRADPKLKTKLTKKVVNVLRTEVDAQLGKALPNSVKAFEKAKASYGGAMAGTKLAEDGVRKLRGQATFGLPELVLGGGGLGGGITASAITSDPTWALGALGVAGATRLARNRGNAAMASTADALGNVAGGLPRSVGDLAEALGAGLGRSAPTQGNTNLELARALAKALGLDFRGQQPQMADAEGQ